MSKYKSERSLIPLLAVVGIVAAPLIFILGVVAGSQIQMVNILTADSLSSWISALATVAIAILTFVLAKETWYLREAQIAQVNELRIQSIRPNVSVKLFSSPISLNLMILEVSNLGKGIARNICFKFYDRDGSEIKESDSVIVDEFLKLHVMSNGFHSLGINQKFESFLFCFYDMKAKIESEGKDIFASYLKIYTCYDDVEGNSYSDEIVIDFKEFYGASEVSDSDPIHKISENIKELTKSFKEMSTSKRINVNIYSSQDRAQEQEDQRKMLEAFCETRQEQLSTRSKNK